MDKSDECVLGDISNYTLTVYSEDISSEIYKVECAN